MRVRFKDEKELKSYGLVIDPSDRNRALPAKLAEQCPILGQSRLLDQLVAAGKEQWADIQKNEKYLTGRYWDFAGTLQEIKDACAGDIHAWAAAYRVIGIDRRRASELLMYRLTFKSRQEAADCPVLEANRLIRQTHHEIGESGKEEAIDAVDIHESSAEQDQQHTDDTADGHEEIPGQYNIGQTSRRPTLDQVKCAVTMLSDRDVDALHAFTADLIRCRASRSMAVTCLPAPRLEYEATDALGNVVWEEV